MWRLSPSIVHDGWEVGRDSRGLWLLAGQLGGAWFGVDLWNPAQGDARCRACGGAKVGESALDLRMVRQRISRPRCGDPERGVASDLNSISAQCVAEGRARFAR